jgi:YVTN family beta-propeller protein
MKKYFVRLSFFWILLAMPLAARSARIYTLNIDGGSVTVIDPLTNKVVQTIYGIPWPRGVAFSPDGGLIYIGSEEEHTLDVVDTKTGQIIKKVPLSGHPAGSFGITKDGKRILIGLNPFYGLALKHNDPEDSGGVDIVDTTSLKRVKTIPIKEGIHDVFMTPDGKYAVVGAATGTFATIIDLQTQEPAWKIPFDTGVLTMAIESGPDGSTSRLFVELRNLNGFAVVDFPNRKEVARIKFPDPIRFGFPNLRHKLGPAKEVGPTEYNPTHGTGIPPDGKTLWVCSRGTNYVYVYSLPELKLVGQVYLPERKVPGHSVETGNPHWLDFTPDGKTVYICLATFNSVTAIDVKTLKEVAQIPVGENPKMIGASVLP